jgi:hypothetical protein
VEREPLADAALAVGPSAGATRALEMEALEASPFDSAFELGEVLAEEDKPLEPSEDAGGPGLSRVSSLGEEPSTSAAAEAAGEAPVRLEVRLRAETLPAALRAWLAEEGEIRLAAELILRPAEGRTRD